MIDVPLRSEGEMIGVICFEHTGDFHTWTQEEQKFTLSVGQLVSLALEAQKKREYRLKLEQLLIQKDILLSEINHRVKHNLGIVLGLINTQQSKVHDAYHESLFTDLKNKVQAMASVQDQLRVNEEVDEIQVNQYFSELVDSLKNTFDHKNKVNVEMNMDDNISMDITKVIPLGLIASEIITNTFRLASLNGNHTPTLKIDCHRENSHVNLSFKDNGVGLDSDTGDGMGLNLVKNLTEQMGGTVEVINDNGTEVDLEFPV